MKKRMLSAFLCLCMMLTMVPAAFATEGATNDADPALQTNQGDVTTPSTVNATTSSNSVLLTNGDASGVCSASSSTGGESTNAVTWSFDSETSTLIISGNGAMADYTVTSSNDPRPWANYTKQIEQVTIKDGVTSIGDYAFYQFPNVKRIDIEGNTLTSIGTYAFATYDENITSFEVPGSVTTIGGWAFAMRSATQLTLPSGIQTIGDCAFTNCSSLVSFQMTGSGSPFTVENGVLFKTENNAKTLVAYPAGNTATNYSVPEGITVIGKYAFNGASALIDITIPASVTTLEDKAFQGTGLTSFSIPNTVTSLGKEILRNCYSLEYLYFNTTACPSGGTTVMENAGRDAENGLVVVFGDEVTSIPANFGYYADTSHNPKITAISFSAVTSIGEKAFYNCTNLRTILVRSNSSNDSITIGNNAFHYVTAEVYAPAQISGLPEGMTQETYPVQEQVAIEAGSTVTLNVLEDLSVFGTISYDDQNYSGSDFSISGNKVTLSATPTESQIPLAISLKMKNLNASISLGTVTVQYAGEKNTITGSTDKWSYSYTYYENVPGEGVLSLTGYTGSSTAIKLPETLSITVGSQSVENVVVSAVASSFNEGSAKTIVIPNGIEDIADGAFSGSGTQIFFLPGSNCATVGTNAFGSAQVYCDSALSSVLGDFATVCDVIADVSASSENDLVIGYLADGKLTLTGSGKMQDIASYNAAPWYGDRAKVVSAEVEDGVTYVGKYFLNDCTNAETLTIGKDVGSSALNAFASPTFDVVYVNSNYEDGQADGYNYRYLESLKADTVVFGSNVTGIPAYLLNDNSAVKKIVILGDTTNVGKNNCQLSGTRTDIYVNNATVATAIADNVKNNNAIYIVGKDAKVYEGAGKESFAAVYKPGYVATWYEYKNNTTDYSGETSVTGAAAGKTYIAVWSNCSHTTKAYIAGGAVLTETCATCRKELGTAAITAPANLTYDGTAKKAAVSTTGTWSAGTPTISYSSGETLLTSEPVNAGTYTASITVDGATASVEFTIEQATPTLTITPSAISISGGGTVTLAITSSGLPSDAAVTVTCDNTAYNPTQGTDGNYTVTLPNTTATYTFTANYAGDANHKDAEVTCTVSVTRYTSSGGSSGGNSGSSSSGDSGSSADVSSPVTSGGESVVTVDVDPSTSGSVARATVSRSDLSKAVDRALDEAEQEDTDPVIEIVVDAPSRADEIRVTLPTSPMADLGENQGAILTILSDVGSITLDSDAITAVADEAGDQVVFTIAPVETDELNSRQQATVGNAPVFDLTIRSGSRYITDFDGGLVTVSLPYELPDDQDPNSVVVWYLDDQGNITPCETTYNVRTQTVTFTTRHFSLYVISHEKLAADNPFTDVSDSAYYYDAVLWAVEQEITNGTTATTFSPNASCTRAQMVTFLWRAAGEPTPASNAMPFADVPANAYYRDAVLWAVEQGITNGISDTAFGPNETVTRGQTVTFLWRYEDSPSTSGNSFTDVAANAYYAEAVAWAVANEITNGTSSTTFSPNDACTRAQIVTFLYRDLA